MYCTPYVVLTGLALTCRFEDGRVETYEGEYYEQVSECLRWTEGGSDSPGSVSFFFIGLAVPRDPDGPLQICWLLGYNVMILDFQVVVSLSHISGSRSHQIEKPPLSSNFKPLHPIEFANLPRPIKRALLLILRGDLRSLVE